MEAETNIWEEMLHRHHLPPMERIGINTVHLMWATWSKAKHDTFFFLDTLSMVCVEVVDMNSLKLLEYNIHKALSRLERDFPVTLHIVVFHLLHHVPAYIARFGPVYSHWMYPYERFNSWLICRVHNRFRTPMDGQATCYHALDDPQQQHGDYTEKITPWQ